VQANGAPFLAGVSNGYEDYARLGLDRWLAVVAAFNLAQKACLVLDLGTAVTSDFVDASGQHRGGFICPGLPLMRSQLQLHTRRIRYSLVADALTSGWLPGRTTVDAVERGCALMLRSFAVGQVELAQEYFGKDFVVFVTGGDAPLIEDVIAECRLVPDLVFAGLALACPLT
jgi:type III pantothenate kinase